MKAWQSDMQGFRVYRGLGFIGFVGIIGFRVYLRGRNTGTFYLTLYETPLPYNALTHGALEVSHFEHQVYQHNIAGESLSIDFAGMYTSRTPMRRSPCVNRKRFDDQRSGFDRPPFWTPKPRPVKSLERLKIWVQQTPVSELEMGVWRGRSFYMGPIYVVI